MEDSEDYVIVRYEQQNHSLCTHILITANRLVTQARLEDRTTPCPSRSRSWSRPSPSAVPNHGIRGWFRQTMTRIFGFRRRGSHGETARATYLQRRVPSVGCTKGNAPCERDHERWRSDGATRQRSCACDSDNGADETGWVRKSLLSLDQS
jgi:hypothetical protein